MKRLELLLLVIIGSLLNANVHAQDVPKVVSELEANAAAGSYRGSLSVAYFRTWKFGEKRRIGIGAGLRYTGLLGANLYYITAPAELTSESTSPLILFKENVVENIDSVLFKSAQVNSINLAINLDYRVSARLTAGFSIDAIGFSFGKKISGNYINGYEGKITEAKPTPFNVLLISDNDRGSLNSELYAKYFVKEDLAIKAGAQFLFSEYTTETNVQQFPEPNDRFRNKSLLFTAGVSLRL
jgi:hypothetical protein